MGTTHPPAFFAIPSKRNNFFTGREEVLQAVLEGFEKGERVQALTGIGGIGKTQIAIEFAYRHREKYTAVFWCHAQTHETLIEDFSQFAHLLNLPTKNVRGQNEIAEEVLCWFATYPNWLLILDHVDDLKLALKYIPSHKNGHVLLTTCTSQTGDLIKPHKIKKFSHQEGTNFLFHRLKTLGVNQLSAENQTELREQAKSLVKIMHGSPLALDQAAAYITDTAISIPKYLDYYSQNDARISLLKERGELILEHPNSVFDTYSQAFRKVEQTNLAAGDLLRICSLLKSDAIPLDIFLKGASELGENLSRLNRNDVGIDIAIKEACRYSLMERVNRETLNLDPLAQIVLRDGMDMNMKNAWANRCIRAVNLAFPAVEFSTWRACDRLMRHVQALLSTVTEMELSFTEASNLLNQVGSYMYERGQYSDAESYLRRALAIRKQKLGPEHPDTAQSLNNLATLYLKQGKYAQAEPLLWQGLAIRKQKLGPEHPDTAQSLNNLATHYRKQGKYAQAEPLLRQGLAIRKQVLGLEHPDTASSLNNLALLYWAQGNIGKAESAHQKALAIRKQRLVPEHPAIAQSLNNLAVLYRTQGRYGQAEPLLRQGLAIRKQVLGLEHPDTASSLHNLALLYWAQGNIGKAEECLLMVRAIREQALGDQHHATVQCLNELAVLYRNQGKYRNAEVLIRRVLMIQEHALEVDHLSLAFSLYDLADNQYLQDKFTEAVSLLGQGEMILENTYLAAHPDVILLRKDYANLRRQIILYKILQSIRNLWRQYF